MAEVEVARAAFERRTLPAAVCIRTGESATTWVRLTAFAGQRRARWLAPIPVALMLHEATTARVDGWVPMSTRAAVRIRLTRRVVAASLLVCILLLAVGFLVNRRGLGQVSLICSLAAGVAGLLERLWSVGAHFDPRHDVVRLTRVHPRFRAALRGE